MTNLYYYSSHSFPTTIKMVRYFDQLKLIPKGFTIGEERELASCLKQLHFTKGEQSIHLYVYMNEQLNELFLFVQEGPLKEKLIRYAPKPFLTRGFSEELFINETTPQEIITRINTHLAVLDKEMKDARPDCLHIYGQSQWHDEAYIVGNRAALERLHKSIGEALQYGESRKCFVPSDDEVYDVYISCVDDAFDFETLPLQYHDTEFFPQQVPPLEAFKFYKIEE